MNLDELLSGYLSLTGRPAATLSVCEYLEFVKVTEERGYNSSYQGKSVNDVSKTESISTENIPNKEENNPVPAESFTNNSKVHHKPTNEQKSVSIPDSAEERKPTSTPKKALHSNSALDLLRSVSG